MVASADRAVRFSAENLPATCPSRDRAWAAAPGGGRGNRLKRPAGGGYLLARHGSRGGCGAGAGGGGLGLPFLRDVVAARTGAAAASDQRKGSRTQLYQRSRLRRHDAVFKEHRRALDPAGVTARVGPARARARLLDFDAGGRERGAVPVPDRSAGDALLEAGR